MTGIIVPEAPIFHASKRRPWGDLTESDAHRRWVEDAAVKMIERSYRDDAVRDGVDAVRRTRTMAEDKRRAKIIGKWFRYLRGDCYFSIARALDECGRALRLELDGQAYEPPPRRRCWTPG